MIYSVWNALTASHTADGFPENKIYKHEPSCGNENTVCIYKILILLHYILMHVIQKTYM